MSIVNESSILNFDVVTYVLQQQNKKIARRDGASDCDAPSIRVGVSESFNVVDTPSSAAVAERRIHFNQRRPGVLDEHTDRPD